MNRETTMMETPLPSSGVESGHRRSLERPVFARYQSPTVGPNATLRQLADQLALLWYDGGGRA